jgi:hypothetical protein
MFSLSRYRIVGDGEGDCNFPEKVAEKDGNNSSAGSALFFSSALGISIPQIACCGWCARAVHTSATERK